MLIFCKLLSFFIATLLTKIRGYFYFLPYKTYKLHILYKISMLCISFLHVLTH